MPYMFCNHKDCNETVKVPAQYCSKHTPFEQNIKASDLLEEQEDKIVVKVKKTTK